MADLFNSLSRFDKIYQKDVQEYSGLLGLTPNKNSAVEVPNRNGYVYVRFRDNQSEVISAYNDKVSPVNNLPVLVTRQGDRWIIVGRDIARYENWGSYSAFLPAHAPQHEFPRDNPGGDIVFSYIDQFMPLNVYPSGTPGSPNVLIGPYTFQKDDDTWVHVNTGTPSLLTYIPTDNQARMVLIYLDRTTGNPGFLVNSGTSFAANLTGTGDIIQYLPLNSALQEPVKAVRLVSGTTYVGWDNLYDVRQFYSRDITGSGGGISDAPSDGLVYGRKDAGWVEVSGTAGGSPAGNDMEVQYNESGAFGASFNYHYDYSNNVLLIGSGTPPALGTDALHVMKDGGSPSMNLWGWTSTSAFAPFVAGWRAGGSRSVPAAVGSDYELMRMRARGYNGVNWTSTQAELLFTAPYDWASGSHPTEASIWVTPSGSATLEQIIEFTELGANLSNGKTLDINNKPELGQGGWLPRRVLWTRTGDNTFTVSGDVTADADYKPGMKIKVTDSGGDVYGVITSGSYSAPNSTIYLIDNDDFNLAAGALSNPHISKIENPDNWPISFAFTPTTTLDVGAGSITAYWSIYNGRVKGSIEFILGSGFSFSGNVQIDFPVLSAAFVTNRFPLGIALIWDDDAGTTYLGNTAYNATTGRMHPQRANSDGAFVEIAAVTSSNPITFAASDEISLTFDYPAHWAY